MNLSSIGNMSLGLIRDRSDPRSFASPIWRFFRSRSWPCTDQKYVFFAFGAISLGIGLVGHLWLDLRIGEAVACALSLHAIASLTHMASRLTNDLRSFTAHLDVVMAITAAPQTESDHSTPPSPAITPGDVHSSELSTETLEILKAIATYPDGHSAPANEDETETRPFPDDALSGDQFWVGRHSYATSPIVTLPHRRAAMVDGQIELPSQPGELTAAEAANWTATLTKARLDFAYAVAFLRTAPKQSAAPKILTRLPESGLSSPDFIKEMCAILDEDPSLREHLVFELPFGALTIRNNPYETVINALRQRALSLSVTIPEQKSIVELANDSCGWNILSHIRIQATSLIKQHPGVLSALRMMDISLIATDVQSDGEVAELLDLEVHYAQGPLFVTGASNLPRDATKETEATTRAKRTPSRPKATPPKAGADTSSKSARSRVRRSSQKHHEDSSTIQLD